MTERIGISLVLLIIAAAHLVTDVVRLASPRPGINDPAPIPTRSVEPEMPRPPPIREQPAQRSGAVAHWAYEHPRAMPANRTSISHPGARHAGIAIRPDMRAGTAMSGESVLSSAAPQA